MEAANLPWELGFRVFGMLSTPNKGRPALSNTQVVRLDDCEEEWAYDLTFHHVPDVQRRTAAILPQMLLRGVR